MLTLVVVGLTIIANLAIVVMVLKRNPNSATHRLIAALSVVTALWTLFNYLALVPGIPETDRLFWVRTVMFFTAPYGTIIMFLANAFPGSKLAYSKKFVWSIVVYDLLTMVLAVSPFMFTKISNTSETNFSLQPGPAIAIYAIGFMGFMGVGFATLIKKLKSSGGLLKSQLKLFLSGLIVSFTLLTLTNFVAVVVFGSIQLTSLGPPFTLIFFACIVYAIVRHGFLDITALVGRGVGYTLLLLSIVGIEAGAVVLGTKYLPAGVNETWVAMAGAVLIVLGYDTLRGVITRLTERIFFQGRYDTEKLLSQLTKVMASEIELGILSDKLITIMKKEMRIAEVLLMSRKVAEEQWSEWVGEEKLWVFDEMEEGVRKEQLRARGILIVAPLFVRNEMVGLLAMGSKASGEIYGEQDIEVLTILVPELAVAIKNAQSYSEIQDFNRTLEQRVAERTEELKSSQERELQKASELLKLKNQFVFMASHDLATPVAAISGYMSLIGASKEERSKELMSYLAAMSESTERLKKLVSDLLQVARGESGTIQVKLANVDLKGAMENVERRVFLLARDRGVKLELLMDGPEAEKVMTDEAKLMEIMENLLTNAIRYRLKKDGGWVKIRVYKKNEEIIIDVQDNGFGIIESEQPKVFTKFFRSERREVREQSGTGLGLFVSQMLAQNMGGKITFISKDNEGSTFSVHLPLAPKGDSR